MRRRRILPTLAMAAVSTALAVAMAAAPANAADPGSRTPGAPVGQVAPLEQSANGGTNPQIGGIPATRSIGRADAGVVPVVGKVSAKADDGAYVIYESRVSSRVLDLTVSSPALGGNGTVRLLLPQGYSAKGSRTWPTLWLLGGASDKADYQAWSIYTDLPSFAADKNTIVAMPTLGKTGLGTNWYNDGKGAAGGYQWDTFLASELPQLLQRGYAASGRQAVGGISTGGFTAMALAAQHPGSYGAVASFSGLNSLQASAPLVQALLVREGISTTKPWGSLFMNRARWNAADPSQHVSDLRSTPIFLSGGNGRPGPLDSKGLFSFFSIDALESATLTNNAAFITQLRFGGVSPTVDLYGDGTHSWPYWSRELRRSWPVLAGGLGL